jgi:hypothetical protein
MMTGMAYELESQWRRDDDGAVARDSMHHRAVQESREARRAGAKRASRPGWLERLLTTFQSATSARTPAR